MQSLVSLYSMRYLLVIAFLFCTELVLAQQKYKQLSPEAEINLITIGPGQLLNDSFGHNAVHVRDTDQDIDIVFNYGTFNFNTPNFYLKFARGQLPYSVGINSYQNFEYSYKLQQRWIASQTLNITQQEKQEIYEFLVHNAQEENRYYNYDFFYDNCSTRPFYIIKNLVSGLEMDYTHQEAGLTHRDLIHQYVPWNTWGSLGIDVALGSVIDRPATPEEYLFLPNELMYAFAKAEVKAPRNFKPLVKQTETVFKPAITHAYSTPFLVSPLFILGLIAVLIVYKTLRDHKKSVPLGWLDIVLLISTGIIGILLSFLWLGTNHTATAWNYNLLWGFPFHILAAFVVTKVSPPQWIYPYMKLAIILMCLLFFHWIVGVQSYALALLPLLIAITLRYGFILRRLKAKR